MQSVDCVLVDEVQFFNAQTSFTAHTSVCDQIGIPVLRHGTRTDFRGEPFPSSMYLLSWAEEIVEIKTVCHSGKKATMNARMSASASSFRGGAGRHRTSLYLFVSTRIRTRQGFAHRLCPASGGNGNIGVQICVRRAGLHACSRDRKSMGPADQPALDD